MQGQGKFEELVVCSHEIAACTAQLTVASKVKANKDSTNLKGLKEASKGVSQATAGVVASAKAGAEMIEEGGKIGGDFKPNRRFRLVPGSYHCLEQ